MWTISDLKQKGKTAFKANYWRYVLVTAILLFLLAASTTSSSKGASSEAFEEALSKLTSAQIAAVFAILGVTFVIAVIIGILIKIFITNPIKVGAYRFFIAGSNGRKSELNVLFSAYKDGRFMNIFLTMFLRDLFVLLWSILFVIPGIIKAYSYRMVPYILAENPDMNSTEIITRSRKLMKGNKMKAFLLDLSFIGWFLLEAITFGILGVFYVNPYVEATNAELYKTLKENH